MQPGVVVAQMGDLHVADGGDDGGRQQVQILVDAGKGLNGVHQQRRRRLEAADPLELAEIKRRWEPYINQLPEYAYICDDLLSGRQ